MFSKLKWLIMILLLLNEQALCRVPPPLAHRGILLPGSQAGEEAGKTAKHDPLAPLGSLPHDDLSASDKSGLESLVTQNMERVQSARQITLALKSKLQGQIQDHFQIKEKVTCEELLSASNVDDPLSSKFPRELLGLSLVPVMVMAGCQKEAQTLVLKLYDLLGEADTEELLMEVEALIRKKVSKSTSTPAPASASLPSERDEESRRIEAVMFNIQQLASVEEHPSIHEGHCEGWARVNGTVLVGTPVEGATGGLDDAVSTCERLGFLCAGVTSTGFLTPGIYQAVLKKGSRVFPSTSPESECWIHQCSDQDQVLIATSSHQRTKRSNPRRCINKNEERVHNVMEWIPGVSTLYGLGTAVYYTSVNCSAIAKERAILTAVDLGTDALMVATGGTAGVAGYALGAGVKTGVKAGVKYLLNSMKKEDDILVNQFSWEDGVFTVQ
ncbi:uncharacterized protein apof [Cololabis saira]|uniref:uncharacterized protein apof n=1 Tax=Cololabis saira TaxID=129043 RepID=UPI002AD4EFC6|nr:uncharacterized protein apof [Cololabis saira]